MRFVDEARPEFATLVQVATFDGPLGLLLTLIEQRQLDILTVPLGELAGAYLEALAGLPTERLPHLSTFVSVAAHLILIKSRAMLPAPPAGPETVADETPDPEAELRARLLVYRRFRDAGARLGLLLDATRAAVPPRRDRRVRRRPGGRANGAGAADGPPAPRRGAGRAGHASPRRRRNRRRLVSRSVTLAERAAAIRAALAHAPAIVLQELLGSGRDRVFMAVTFLALLELVKRREVVAVQAVPWGPIECRLAAHGRPGVSADTMDLDPQEAAALGRLVGATPGPEQPTCPWRSSRRSCSSPNGRYPAEIAALAGVDAETVDARLGDLEVAPRTAACAWSATTRRSELTRRPKAALYRRYVGSDPRVCRQLGWRRWPSWRPSAGHPRPHRTDPRRATPTTCPLAAVPPPHPRAGPGRHAGAS